MSAMFVEVRASLIVRSHDPGQRMATITDMLGIEPTKSWDYGDPWPSKSRPDRLRNHGHWSFREPRTIGEKEDPHSMESLVRLAERFEPKSAALEQISTDFEIVVGMYGYSDSGQAGFYIGPETMRRLGLLHASFWPDIYLAEELRASDLDDA